MSRPYSPRTFLRKVPNRLLKDYFALHGGLPGVDFDKLAENDMGPVFDGILTLTPKTQTRIESDFHEINKLACLAGTRAILEEAAMTPVLQGIGAKSSQGRGEATKVDWPKQFSTMKNDYERAFWTFLNHRDVFQVANDLMEMDRIGSWRKWPVGKGLTPAVEEKIQPFTDGICEFYRPQGRGHRCHVENYLRQTPDRHCYFVYPADYPSTEPGYSETGEFGEQDRRPAIEMIFVYRPETGMLETSAGGKGDEVEALLDIFCRTILGLPRLPQKPAEPTYDLSGLKNRDFPLDTEPQDAIESVCVKRMKLELPGGSRRVTLDITSRNTKPAMIYDLMDLALNKEKVPLETLLLTHVKFQFIFKARDGKREKRLTFEITHPDRCTLEDDDPYDQVAMKYLKLWKIARG